jgi:hypothetical protein
MVLALSWIETYVEDYPPAVDALKCSTYLAKTWAAQAESRKLSA